DVPKPAGWDRFWHPGSSGFRKQRDPCTFPFSYKGRRYTACTMDDSKRPWCATTSNYEANHKWRYCDSSPCVFPFIYKGKTYQNCTSSGKLWCSTTGNYDVDKKWTYCSKPGRTGDGGNYDKPCVFPFIYKKFKFRTCTNLAEAKGKFWCSTTDNYDRDHQWSYCSVSLRCTFPFIYKGRSYSSCTTDRLWCATTSDYDKDGKWKFCTRKGESLCLCRAN
uniref:Fibronectin type-II domain-containing protein n=1 Tax=Chrysemys picta bellii TaxID=8478 RepID=A0A8C3I296_CHRPI